MIFVDKNTIAILFVLSEENFIRKRISTKLEGMLRVITEVLPIVEKHLRRVMYLDHLIVQFSYKVECKCSPNQIQLNLI